MRLDGSIVDGYKYRALEKN